MVVGHRGGRQLAPENTMAAFRGAWAHGSDMIELDVRRTRDGILVLSHDARVDSLHERLWTDRGSHLRADPAASHPFQARRGRAELHS